MTTNYDLSILRKLRQQRKWTLEQLAEAAGLSYPTVASIERNKTTPSLKTIDAIADALGISTGSLITLASRKKARVLSTESIHDKILMDLGTNLEKIHVTKYEGLKVFRAMTKPGVIANSTRLQDNRNCFELCYCLSGSIEIRVEDEIFELQANELILFDGKNEHEYAALTNTEYLVIHVPKETREVELLFECSPT